MNKQVGGFMLLIAILVSIFASFLLGNFKIGLVNTAVWLYIFALSYIVGEATS